MELTDILREVMAITKTSQSELARLLDVSPQNISQAFKNQTIKWSYFCRCMDHMGYEMVFRPKTGMMEIKVK